MIYFPKGRQIKNKIWPLEGEYFSFLTKAIFRSDLVIINLQSNEFHNYNK